MRATSTREMHFKNFMGFGVLCGSTEGTDLVTLRPDEVTCQTCLAAMGRSRPPEPDDGPRAP